MISVDLILKGVYDILLYEYYGEENGKKVSILEELILYLKENNYLNENVVDVNANLTDEYGIDSLTIVDIIVFCEEKFDVEFDFLDLDLNNFSTLSRIEFTVNNLLGK